MRDIERIEEMNHDVESAVKTCPYCRRRQIVDRDDYEDGETCDKCGGELNERVR